MFIEWSDWYGVQQSEIKESIISDTNTINIQISINKNVKLILYRRITCKKDHTRASRSMHISRAANPYNLVDHITGF
jgi:hypothetical protein